MIEVQRPPVSRRAAADMIDLQIELAQGALEDPTAWKLWNNLRTTRQLLALASVVRTDSRLLEDSARWHGQTVALLLAGLAGRTGKLPFGDRKVAIPQPDKDVAGPWRFADGLLATWIARDDATRKTLAGIDSDVLRDLPVESDDVAFEWVRLLQGLARGDGKLADAVKAVGSAAKRATNVKPALAKVTVAEATAAAALASDDEAAFGEALPAALRAHHGWYGKDDARDEYQGWVALGPLALACAAHDRGWEVPVKSEYLPQALIERRYAD